MSKKNQKILENPREIQQDSGKFRKLFFKNSEKSWKFQRVPKNYRNLKTFQKILEKFKTFVNVTENFGKIQKMNFENAEKSWRFDRISKHFRKF